MFSEGEQFPLRVDKHHTSLFVRLERLGSDQTQNLRTCRKESGYNRLKCIGYR